ncbi:MAG TPA: nuclear transport factor 2 family protein [Steroidobacteraceae bacterium]|nr:nuclear transport factor 2 family protein [Steroidobacteraceae bacterium]
MNPRHGLLATLAITAALLAGASSATEDHASIVAALDTEYQAAVERNDWQVMDRILHPDFTLVLGDGKVYSRAELIASARDKHIEYEKQVEMPGTQAVRVFGRDTATVTALLWLKGVRKSDASAFEYKLWFSDTYVRTAGGWRYAFGQASLRLP